MINASEYKKALSAVINHDLNALIHPEMTLEEKTEAMLTVFDQWFDYIVLGSKILQEEARRYQNEADF